MINTEMTRLIPKNNGKGQIYPVSLGFDPNEIEYQPRYGIFFIPEHLGFRIGDYVDFFEWKLNNEKFLCMLTMGCVKSGRKISSYEKHNAQKISRQKGNARVSFVLPDFNEWYLGLPFPKNIPPNENHGRIFHGWLYAFAEHTAKQWSTKCRLGIVMSTVPIRILNGKTNPTIIKPSELSDNESGIFTDFKG